TTISLPAGPPRCDGIFHDSFRPGALARFRVGVPPSGGGRRLKPGLQRAFLALTYGPAILARFSLVSRIIHEGRPPALSELSPVLRSGYKKRERISRAGRLTSSDLPDRTRN